MGRKMKIVSLWIRRRSHLPVLLIGVLVVVVLFFNEETSFTSNLDYEREIRELKAEIKANRDSAAYYRMKRERIITGAEDLEFAAREQYHMQRPTEDIYIIKEGAD